MKWLFGMSSINGIILHILLLVPEVSTRFQNPLKLAPSVGVRQWPSALGLGDKIHRGDNYFGVNFSS